MEGDTPVDRVFRAGYRLAYRMMRVYWAVRRPDTHGALVALWHDGRILVVKNSYLDYYSLPGGYVRRGETAREAAVRELAEEVGLSVSVDELKGGVDVTHRWENKRDHVEIFELEVTQRPEIRIDRREVVAAEWLEPAEALERKLFPPLSRHIRERAAR